MTEHIYYAIGYNYQKPTEWFAGTHNEALNVFGQAVIENKTSRVRVLVEVYSVDDDSNADEHVCERGCPLHLAGKHVWIYKGWEVPAWLRKVAAKVS